MSSFVVDYLKEKLARREANRARLAQDRDVNQRMLDNSNAALDLVDQDIVELKEAIALLGGADETV